MAATFDLGGHEAVATPWGALVLRAMATLVVADLHLEKGSSFAQRGRLLPPYDSATTLRMLAEAVHAWSPRRVVCLGDSFHNAGAADRLSTADRERLGSLAHGRTWIWVAGNHDPDHGRLGGHFGNRFGDCLGIAGERVAELSLDGLRFRHQATGSDAIDAGDGSCGESGEVLGHFHPKVSVRAGGRRVSMRCFVNDGRRLILPAFGAYTGGLDVSSPEILALMAPAFRVYAIGRTRIHTFPGAALIQ